MKLKGDIIHLDDVGVDVALELNTLRNIMHEEVYNRHDSSLANAYITRALRYYNFEKFRFYGDNDLVNKVEEEVKAKKTKEIRDQYCLKLISLFKRKEDYPVVFSKAKVDINKDDEDFYSKLCDTNVLSLETKLCDLAGVEQGDVIVRFPLKDSRKQKIDHVRINDIPYYVSDNMVSIRKKYGFEPKDYDSIPFVKIYSPLKNKPTINDVLDSPEFSGFIGYKRSKKNSDVLT